MSGSGHVVCLFGKKRKKARQIPKAHLVISMAYHMKRQGQSPSLTFFLYIKQAPDSAGIQFLNEGHPVFSHLPVAEEIKRQGEYFICIHDDFLFSFYLYVGICIIIHFPEDSHNEKLGFVK